MNLHASSKNCLPGDLAVEEGGLPHQENKMSSRQMEEMEEERFHRALAEEIGISVDDLSELAYEAEPHETSDGMMVGYNVTFDPDASDPDILATVPGLVNGSWIRVGLLGGE